MGSETLNDFAGSRNTPSLTKVVPDKIPIDPITKKPIGRLIGDTKGNLMIEPKGGSTVPAGKNGVDTHTTYPNGSNYQRLNPQGHGKLDYQNGHAHGHLEGTGVGKNGQGSSIDIKGNIVAPNSKEAHWNINK